MRREKPIDYCEYHMDLLYDNGSLTSPEPIKYGYLVFKVVKGTNLNHFDLFLRTNKNILQNEEGEATVIGEEIPLCQLKKLYQFLGLTLNLGTEESEVE